MSRTFKFYHVHSRADMVTDRTDHQAVSQSGHMSVTTVGGQTQSSVHDLNIPQDVQTHLSLL